MLKQNIVQIFIAVVVRFMRLEVWFNLYCMKKMVKNLLIGAAVMVGSTSVAMACTGISLKAADGSYVQSRTIEWAKGALKSEYVIIPRGEDLQSYTPTGLNGLKFKSRYGVVGLAVVEKEFIAEGINEKGLSAGLFFFPTYGSYGEYNTANDANTLARKYDLSGGEIENIVRKTEIYNILYNQECTLHQIQEMCEDEKLNSKQLIKNLLFS